MDIDDDDDFYADSEPQTTTAQPTSGAPPTTDTKPDPRDDLEEGEEEDEGGEMDEDDSDIEIITERKDNTIAPPQTQSRYSEIRNIPQRTATSDTSKPASVKKESPTAQQPPVSTSTVDVNANPVYKPVGKPIISVNIDEDLADKDKPWRKPGTDLSDYFNYGFDEFSWALYADKQQKLRGEYSQEALAEKSKKMMEEMTSMMGMPPGMGGMMQGMAGMDGMTPEMQAMMQQMMASGMDPSQMDPAAMSAIFAGMQGNGGVGGSGSGTAQGGGQSQNFGGQGFGGNQNQGYGYDQGGGMNRGGGFGGGRGGRGGRRNW